MRICKIGEPSSAISKRFYPIGIIEVSLKSKFSISSGEVNSAIEKYKKGNSLRDIAKSFKCSKNRIRDLEKKTIHQINQALDQKKLQSRCGKKWSWAAIKNIVARFETKEVVIN